jgi:hypothetical protein
MDGWIVLHELTPWVLYDSGVPMEERDWREVVVSVSAIFCIAPPPSGWASGAVVHSSGTVHLAVRETRDEIIALCEVARKGRL